MIRPATLCRALTVCGLLVTSIAPGQDVLKRRREKIQIDWAEHETKNYRIQHEKVIPSATVERIGRELEDILEQYVRLFRTKPESRFEVEFLDSLNTYEQSGGDPSHPGMYHPGDRVLLLRQMPFSDLVPTVYHEAFHQYIHLYVGDGVEIPIWFNEGMAMHFEGMQRDKRRKDQRLDPQQIDFRKARMVKDAIFTRAHIPLATLVDATYEQFHDKDKEALYYHQSFSVVYFLMKASGGRLPVKFMDTLRDTKDLEAANAVLFGKERKNLEKIEAQWKTFLAGLKIPDA